ncbi:MAG TPA: dTDP-4-dehydrorhamnose 3,5-epimerase [Terriglobales bacterium]
MRVVEAYPSGLMLLEPEVYSDDRGHFFESFNQRALERLVGAVQFVQDNQSRSRRMVLRGLHYQVHQPQGKLIRVLQGEIFDVAVDLREGSPWFGRWNALLLRACDQRMLWIPPGFAHGFLALSDRVEVHYKTTEYYAPQYERTLAWNDLDLGIPWPLDGEPILSAKDAHGIPLRDAETCCWPMEYSSRPPDRTISQPTFQRTFASE